MIIEYHRPESSSDALVLLSRPEPRTLPMGGGLYINEVIQEPVAVVDLQALGLTGIKKKGNYLHLGASERLQSLVESGLVAPALVKAITHQETYNRRQVATLAGTLVAANGRSAIAAVILALDAELVLLGPDQAITSCRLGDFFPVRTEILAGTLISEILLPDGIQAAYEYVARSPADLPIIAAAVASWPGGRTRVVLAGCGDQPRMVFDGPDPTGAELAARDAYSAAGDQWASAGYRSAAAEVLVRRCLDQIAGKDKDIR